MSGGSSEPTGPEYYIRGLNDTEARGPFSMEQLRSLTESSDPAKNVTPETYFYDATSQLGASCLAGTFSSSLRPIGSSTSTT